MRVQGTYLSDQEIERMVEFWKHNAPMIARADRALGAGGAQE